MRFRVGDKVSVLDEDLSGLVKEVIGDRVSVETEDGFLLEFGLEELVLEKRANDDMEDILFSHKSTLEANISKETGTKPKQSLKKKSREKRQPAFEVDLHIHQLVKSTKGMSNFDMLTLQLDTAQRQLEFAIKKRIQRIVFIHGVGAGVLKLELEYLFKRYDNLKYYDANFQKYGLGATEVYIFQNQSS